MAKSIEQKVVEQISNALSDSRFRHYEFIRILLEQPPHLNKAFFGLVLGYLKYLAIFNNHGYYPNGVEKEARAAAVIIDDLVEEYLD